MGIMSRPQVLQSRYLIGLEGPLFNPALDLPRSKAGENASYKKTWRTLYPVCMTT